MIQAILLIALGFLAASLIGVLLAPSLWNRAARLSKKKLESTLPLTLAEIEAAQDQLRASYAVRLRRLETALASAKQKAANQLVDNSRLQMQIAALKDQIGDLDMKLSERRNAATVLEQTITKRFPELDREITAVKTQLSERSFELQDLTNRLARRDEDLAAAQRAAANYQDEIDRLRGAMEKSAADRSGRRVRKASQWSLEDYKAEYDRLNLEMSKLRQQLAHFQDRDAQQVGVIKGELQKLAELILASAPPKPAPRPTEQRPDIFAKRPSAYEPKKDRPAPWLQAGSPPAPLTQRLRLTAEAAESAAPPQSLAAIPRDRAAEGEAGPAPVSPVLSILPEETVLASPPKNGPADTAPRSKILLGVVAEEAAAAPLTAEGARESAGSSQDGRQTAEAFAGTVALAAAAAAERAAPAPEKEAAPEEAQVLDASDGESAAEEAAPEEKAPREDAQRSNDEALVEAPALGTESASLAEAGRSSEALSTDWKDFNGGAPAEAAAAEAPAEGNARPENGHAAATPAPANGHATETRAFGDAPDLTEARGADRLTPELEPEGRAAAQPSSLLERLRAAEDAAEAKP